MLGDNKKQQKRIVVSAICKFVESAMSNRRKRSAASANLPKAPAQDKAALPATSRVIGWRLWAFRLLALVAAPALFFCLVELVLRLAGFGYPTAFLLPTTQNGQKVFVQNNQFGWRFFRPELARTPSQFSIPQAKASDTVRIFVFGESAAYGDPQPDFGLPRMLQTMLSLRHPGVRFEVVNAAMTAINSHVILPIARDCASAGGDIWVIYMGNNEVVGPFGAGTVFGSQATPLPLIRATLALKTTRTGQWLDSVRQWLQKPPPEKSEWGGMEMFLGQQVRADDPRMNAVYHHFERNLADIIRAGQYSGANLVVSTVAVNLKDCAPFASVHRPGLSGSDQAKWEQLYQFGIKAQAADKAQEAAEQFQAAAQIDDHFADLRFRQGECALALGKILEAQRQFQAACDLDTLRFRCDSRLNDLIRQAAPGRESGRILFADAQRAFADHSPDGLPGEDLFYEHVHLNFDGNYFLARTIAAKIEELLPEWVAARSGTNQPWPSVADCARRLAWTDWSWQAVLSDIFARLKAPPFTGQLNHDSQMQRLTALREKLAPAKQLAGISEARRVCEEALAVAPDDPVLYSQLAALKRMTGDLTGAEAAARRELELVPSDSEGWSELGKILAQQRRIEEASVAFRRAFQLNQEDMGSRLNLAQLLATHGQREEAIRECRRGLAISPRSFPILLYLGQLLEQTERKAEADDCYQKALATGTNNSPADLARFCRGHGWLEAAVTIYNRALKLDPSNAILHVEAGQALETLGRYAEAADQSAEALRLAPELAESHLFQGTLLWQQGKAAGAGEQFLEALRLNPERLDARMDLGMVLMTQGRSAEALAQFEEVLQRSPTNEAARRFIERLRAKPGSGSSP